MVAVFNHRSAFFLLFVCFLFLFVAPMRSTLFCVSSLNFKVIVESVSNFLSLIGENVPSNYKSTPFVCVKTGVA